MHGILKTIGIDFSSNEYIQIIKESFNSIQFDDEHSNDERSDDEGTETDLIHNNTESAVEELLLLHQQRLMTRRNLPDEYDFTASNTNMMHNSEYSELSCTFNRRYSFFELINHWIRLSPFLNPIKIMKEMAQHRGEYI